MPTLCNMRAIMDWKTLTYNVESGFDYLNSETKGIALDGTDNTSGMF
jgi:hypothetical protein